MSGINLKHSLAIVGIVVGALTTAGSAGAATHESGVIGYNGHAGLGASVYQHDQTDLEFLASSRLAAGINDGTSNTVAFGERSATPGRFSIDVGGSENVAAHGRATGATLMADMGGQFQ